MSLLTFAFYAALLIIGWAALLLFTWAAPATWTEIQRRAAEWLDE